MSFIGQVEIFSTMDKYEVFQICDAFIEISFPKGDFVITEGEISDYFYIVLEGKANALKKINGENIIVERYKEGGYFGELALLFNQPRAASVIAETDCNLVYLEKGNFKRLLSNLEGSLEETFKKNAENYKKPATKKK